MFNFLIIYKTKALIARSPNADNAKKMCNKVNGNPQRKMEEI
jgi:hypothetical protein